MHSTNKCLVADNRTRLFHFLRPDLKPDDDADDDADAEAVSPVFFLREGHRDFGVAAGEMESVGIEKLTQS